MAEMNRVELMKRQLDAALQSFEDPVEEPADASAAPAAATVPTPDLLRTVVRLAVGTLLIARDALAQRVALWEQLASQVVSAGPAAEEARQPDMPAEPVVLAGDAALPAAPPDSEAVLVLIGWLSSVPDRLAADADLGRALELARVHLAATLSALGRGSAGALSRGWLGPPSMLDDPELQRWAALGAAEAQRSRAVAGVAILSLVREVVGYLSSEPAIRQLVQEQGTTMAGDVLGEVREYTVSGDSFADTLVQRIFGRRPALPAAAEPPQAEIVVPAGEDAGA